MNIDTKIFNKVQENQIQEHIKRICTMIKKDLSQECKYCSMLLTWETLGEGKEK